jgi:tetratricopeptide (TPR) repeat protein
MPFAALCAALGAAWAAGRLRAWDRGRPWLVPALGAALLGYFLVVNLGGETGFGEHPQTFRTAAGKQEAGAAPQPEVDLDALVAQGMRMQISGERAGAKAAFEQVLALAPQYGPPRQGLALLALGEGDPKQALNQLEQALAAAPYFAEAQALRVAIQLKQAQYGSAFESCARCVEYRPDYPPCQYLMAQLFLDYRQDYRRAAEHYEQYLHLNLRAHQNQREMLQSSLEKNPGSVPVQKLLGLVEQYLGSEQKGRITPASWFYLNRLKAGAMSGRVKPDDAGVYFYLGLAYEWLGEQEKAMRAYEQSLQIGEFVPQVNQRLEALRQGGQAAWPRLGAQLYQAEVLVKDAVAGYFDGQYGTEQGQDQPQ